MNGVGYLSATHYAYLAGIVWIIVTMIRRLNVMVPSILSTVVVTLAWTHNPVAAIGSIFKASFVAAQELFDIFLVIALVTALLGALRALGADELMVRPFRKLMRNGHVAYFAVALATYGISLFFWPTPAIPLVGAVLVPAAIASGLPPLMCAVAMAIAGQGMALSSDYVIGVAPAITAHAAGADAALVAHRTLVLSLVTGGVALVLTYLRLRRSVAPPSAERVAAWQSRADVVPCNDEDEGIVAVASAGEREGASRLFAVLTPLSFAAVVALMLVQGMVSWMPRLKGDDAAALVGGTAVLLMLCAAWAAHGRRVMLETTAAHVTDGFVFAFRAMGGVLPIAGFFFLGTSKTAAAILGVPVGQAPDLLFGLVQRAELWIPHGPMTAAFSVLGAGMVVGIDGSGFAGLPLVGGLSGALADSVHLSSASLAAVGQMGSVWTGGGTLIAWSSLIAVAGVCRIHVMDAVRAMLFPVCAGLVVSTVTAVLLWH